MPGSRGQSLLVRPNCPQQRCIATAPRQSHCGAEQWLTRRFVCPVCRCQCSKSEAHCAAANTLSLHPTAMLPADLCRRRPRLASHLPHQPSRQHPACIQTSTAKCTAAWSSISRHPSSLMPSFQWRHCSKYFCFVRWCCWGSSLVTLLFSRLRTEDLLQMGDQVSLQKKVEFPASLSKRERLFYHTVLFWLEFVPKGPSLPHGV
jgi:hypothetical protein